MRVDSIEFVLLNMYMPCDMGYANHDLFECIDVLNEVSDICNKTAFQYFVLGVILMQTYQGILPIQELSVHLLIMHKLFYVLMPNVFQYTSKSNGCKSTIDHFMVTLSLINYHVPLCLDMEIYVSYHETFDHKCKTNVAWHKCIEVHIENNDYVSCVDYQCEIHTVFISDLYNTIVNSCIIASDMCSLKAGVKEQICTA